MTQIEADLDVEKRGKIRGFRRRAKCSVEVMMSVLLNSLSVTTQLYIRSKIYVYVPRLKNDIVTSESVHSDSCQRRGRMFLILKRKEKRLILYRKCGLKEKRSRLKISHTHISPA